MCGGGSVEALAGNIKGQIKEAQTPKRAGQMLLSGGASGAAQISDNGKTLDSLGRKTWTSESRESGILPDKKVKVDPAAERAAAAAEATSQANARIAFMRKAQRDNSLVTGGGNAARGTLGV
jgi:hypothetical protein